MWFNQANKVSVEKCKDELRNMANLVGIYPDVFSNKSGRATLITRMAARGVPDQVGMAVSGHHTTSGYGRYERTKVLKQEATTLLSHTPGMSYDEAFKVVSAKFVKEKLIGTSENLHPLMDVASEERMKELREEHSRTRKKESTSMLCDASSSVTKEVGGSNVGLTSNLTCKSVAITRSGQELDAWHNDYNGIDWEHELKHNPILAKALGGRVSLANFVAGHSFSNIHNCNITIQVLQPSS